MTILLFANQAQTTIALPVTPSDTTIYLASGTGEYFPNPEIGQAFKLTLVSSTNALINEIVLVTARTGDVLTVIRGDKPVPGIDADNDIIIKPLAGFLNQPGIFHGHCAQNHPFDSQCQHFLNCFDIAHAAAQLRGDEHDAGDVPDDFPVFRFPGSRGVQVDDMETVSAHGLPFQRNVQRIV